ncbi:hypothetical protein COLO4_10528 [Corchorus olitorius]|uniref:RRM domain-containing protein n=1 Tax=Corchorus olitorius TaxID=93759 RepID=A0A1R3K873_9ROSI|nr:hypothetical protein COLO4_10528 [Corchorus olitorius]
MPRSSCTLYVGNLPGDTRMREVEDLFYKYGPIVDIDLKIPPRPPGYAFVEFEDPRDAEDAMRARDGYNFDGYRLRVELAHGGRRPSSSADRHGSYSGSSSRGPSRHSDYRVLVTGLPSSASWQDLKDHMRKAGDVCFSQVFRDRGGMTGIVDYTNYDDMKYAIRKLDDSEFRNAFSRSYIRVKEYDSRYDSRRSYSRSPSPSLQGPNTRVGLDLYPDLFHHVPAQYHLLAPIQVLHLSQCHCHYQVVPLQLKTPIWLFAAIWGLDVRNLMGCGAQMPATHFVVEISLQIQISNSICEIRLMSVELQGSEHYYLFSILYEENELILASVLQGLYDVVAALLLRMILEIETDANVLVGKVAIQNMLVSAPLSEQLDGSAMTELLILRLFGNRIPILPLHKLQHLSLANFKIVADEILRSVNMQIELSIVLMVLMCDVYCWQDGAMVANNPSIFTIREAQLLWPDTKIDCLVSISCGSFTYKGLQFILHAIDLPEYFFYCRTEKGGWRYVDTGQVLIESACSVDRV